MERDGAPLGVETSLDPSVAWVRLPAAIATAVAVAATALVGRRVGGPLVGALAGVQLAVVGDVLVYRDGNHVTATCSRWHQGCWRVRRG